MLQTSVKVSTCRLLFPLVALFSSACGIISPTPPISDPVAEQETAPPEQKTGLDKDKSIPAPSPLSGKESAEPNPDTDQGIYHVVRPGQTLYSLSRSYQVPLERLLQINPITDPTKIRAGTQIFIPQPAGPARLQPPVMGELAWPLKGRINARFGPRGKRARHRGIDIRGEVGEEIAAAASGTVIQAGTRRKYGKTIVIEHSDGLSTLYAHASKLLVRVGDRVEQGDPIAKVGRSGNARGAHLHFEVRRHDQPVDPIPYLESSTMIAASPR